MALEMTRRNAIAAAAVAGVAAAGVAGTAHAEVEKQAAAGVVTADASIDSATVFGFTSEKPAFLTAPEPVADDQIVDTAETEVLIIGAGPTGICTLLCVMLKAPKRIIVCEKDPVRIAFVREHYPNVLVCQPEDCEKLVGECSDHGGADVVLEVAGAKSTFELAWRCARPNAIVTVVALYDEAQTLPLPEMYGKNLTFKTGGVDGCDCAEILRLIEQGKIDTTPLITHRFPLSEIEEAYRIFENRLDNVIKVAVTSD